MRCLVTGASGFVGNALCEELSRQRYIVRAAMRTSNDGFNNIEQSIIGSIDIATDWSAALSNSDVVIHLAARVHIMNDKAVDPLAEFRRVNVEGTLNLARQAVKAGVKRFIFISSIGVNGFQTKFPVTELDIPNPHNAYALSKFEAEKGLQKIASETGMEVVIIRPPLVYGSGVKANFATMMRAVKRGIPLPLGAINNKRSYVYVGNLVSLIAKCIDHPAAANQVFLVSDGHDLSTTALLQECARVLGVKTRLLPVPQRLIETCAALFGMQALTRRLCGNLQVDITKARTLLGWTPPFSVADGLKATALGLSRVDK